MTELKIVTYQKELPLEQNVKNLVLFEVELNKQLKSLKKLNAIYGDEIAEQKQNLHVTKGGDVMFISDMKDDHLVNTVRLMLRNGTSFNSRKMKKYINEIKKRGLVNEIICEETVEDTDEPIDEPDYFEYDEF